MSSKHAVFFISFFLFHSVIHAQDTSYNQLDEVVVTANKFAQKQSTTGKVITVINKDLIEKSAGKTLTQLLNEQVGIVINGALNNQGSVQTVYIRGASSGRTLILLDGIPVNDPSSINNEFDLNLLALDNVERIEICKGAQSTLYGSDAVAGVINIITTKKSVSKPFNGDAIVSAGNYGSLKGNLQLYGKTGRLNYTARYTRLRTNGFSAATDTLYNSTYKFDNDGYTGELANAQVSYQATDALMLRTFALYSHYNTGLDYGGFTDDKDFSVTNRDFITGGGFNVKKNSFAVVGNYQFSQLKRHFVNDSLDKTNTIFVNNNYQSKNQFAELYGNVNIGKHFTIITGGDYRFVSFNNLYISLSTFGPFNDTSASRSVNQKSVYSSVIYKAFSDKLNIELGGRINDHSIYKTNRTYTFNPSYSLTDKWHVFASASTGYKTPSLFQLFDKYSGNESLKAEESKNYEAGLSFQDKRISARSIYFYRDIKNGIDYNYTTFQYFNYVKQVVKGAELEMTLKPVSYLTINANYTYLSPRETSQNRITDQDTITYHYLLRRPKNSLNATIGVQPVKPFYISFSGKYISNRYDAGGYQVADVLLKSYAVFSAYAGYTYKKNTKLFAQAQNLFNKRFYDVYGYNSIPFLINGGVTFSF